MRENGIAAISESNPPTHSSIRSYEINLGHKIETLNLYDYPELSFLHKTLIDHIKESETAPFVKYGFDDYTKLIKVNEKNTQWIGFNPYGARCTLSRIPQSLER
jgi:hypothetical protein